MFFLVWLALSICIGIIASGRGRSGFGWFLIAVIISPLISLVLLLVMKNLRAEEEESVRAYKEKMRQQQEDEHRLELLAAISGNDGAETKQCPYCAEKIKKQAVFCRFCNKDLPD